MFVSAKNLSELKVKVGKEKKRNPKGWFFKNKKKEEDYDYSEDYKYGDWYSSTDPETGEIFNEGSGICEERYGRGLEEHETSDGYNRFPEKEVMYCRFYSALSEWLEKEGFKSSDGWKINLFDCQERGKTNRYPMFKMKEDFLDFDLSDKLEVTPRPNPAIYFSNYYDPENHDTDNSWIEYMLSTPYKKDIEWINPNTCKFFVVAKFNRHCLMSQEKYSDLISKYRRVVYSDIDWKYYANEDDYCGISLPDPNSFEGGDELGKLWNVPTWAVWRSQAFKDIHIFTLDDLPDYILDILQEPDLDKYNY